jgi:hypothetical protein
MTDPTRLPTGPTSSSDRRPYLRPEMRVYGPLASLTRGGAPSAVSDAGNNSMRPA